MQFTIISALVNHPHLRVVLKDKHESSFQNDFDNVLNPGGWDPNLFLGITLAASTTAVLVLSALGLMLIKRRRKQMRLKQNQIEQEEEDSRLRDQYSVSSSLFPETKLSLLPTCDCNV